MNKKAKYGEIMRYIPDYGDLFMQKARKTKHIKLTNPERLIPGGFLYNIQ
jgi:hypothetical protein